MINNIIFYLYYIYGVFSLFLFFIMLIFNIILNITKKGYYNLINMFLELYA